MASNAYEQGKAGGWAQGCGTATARDWSAYQATVNGMPEQGWIAELRDFQCGFTDGVAAWRAEHPYSVLEFGSHPDSGNDDCHTGQDFATLAEARGAYLAISKPGVAFVMLDGPGVNEVRPNPCYRAPRCADGDDGRYEMAMHAGMAFGCDGFNDALGY